MEPLPITDKTADRYNLFAFLKGIGLDQSHFQLLINNGFDSLDVIEPLTVELAMSIGIKNKKDASCLVESKDSLFLFANENKCKPEQALLVYERKIPLNSLNEAIMVKGAVNKKRGKDEKIEDFFNKVIYLSIIQKQLTDIVFFEWIIIKGRSKRM